MMDLLNEMAEHRFGNLEVCDDAVLHRPDRYYIPWGSSQHALGFLANRQNVRGSRLNRDDGRLSQNNPSIPYVDERVCRPKIDTNVVGKQAFNLRQHEFGLTETKTKRDSRAGSRLLTPLGMRVGDS